MTMELIDEFFSRHPRQLMEQFRTGTVGIAGCGGLGSNCAVALARSGVGHLVIADLDLVEPSNLNRQQFGMDQLGRPKALCLKENIEAAVPATEVTHHILKLTRTNIQGIFSGCSIIVEAFDGSDQKTMLIETVLSRMPGTWIVAASGIAGMGRSDELKVKRFDRLLLVGDGTTEPGEDNPLLAPRVGIAANMQADLVLQILSGTIT